MCIYIYIERERERDESSNGNSNLIVNMRTADIAPRGIFTLNNHVLFRMNNKAFSVIQNE